MHAGGVEKNIARLRRAQPGDIDGEWFVARAFRRQADRVQRGSGMDSRFAKTRPRRFEIG